MRLLDPISVEKARQKRKEMVASLPLVGLPSHNGMVLFCRYWEKQDRKFSVFEPKGLSQHGESLLFPSSSNWFGSNGLDRPHAALVQPGRAIAEGRPVCRIGSIVHARRYFGRQRPRIAHDSLRRASMEFVVRVRRGTWPRLFFGSFQPRPCLFNDSVSLSSRAKSQVRGLRRVGGGRYLRRVDNRRR